MPVTQAMDAMLDHVELTCEVSFALDSIMDEVEGAWMFRFQLALHGVTVLATSEFV